MKYTLPFLQFFSSYWGKFWGHREVNALQPSKQDLEVCSNQACRLCWHVCQWFSSVLFLSKNPVWVIHLHYLKYIELKFQQFSKPRNKPLFNLSTNIYSIVFHIYSSYTVQCKRKDKVYQCRAQNKYALKLVKVILDVFCS